MGIKALAYADLQATVGHERCFNAPDTSLQLWRVRKLYEDLYKIFKKHGCSCLWDAGDTTDDRSDVPIPAIDAVLEGLEPFPDHELNLMLIGNHQQYSRDARIHIGRVFSHKFNVVNQTDVFEAQDTLIVCAGYPGSHEATAKWISETAYAYRNYERRLLFGHFQAIGAKMSSGQAISGIPREILEKFSLGLLGHIHKPQKLGRNTHYIGSPFQQNFGERNEAKRVAVVDVETLEVEWVPLTGFPEYRVVEFRAWLRQVNEEDEHRYEVIIRNPKDAEEFYKHPLMARAKPTYDYQMDSKAKADAGFLKAWTRQDVMKRWLQLHPPSEYGIALGDVDVLDVGDLLATEDL